MRLFSILLLAAAAPLAAAVLPEGTTLMSRDGRITLRYPAAVQPALDFGGRALLSGGWRVMWDGKPAGPGVGLVSFTQRARPSDGRGQASEMVRFGGSRDRHVIASCLSAGFDPALAHKLPDRTINGRSWTAWRGSDAGMNQGVEIVSLRTRANGACYALDRISYVVRAAEAPPAGTPNQKTAAATMDAIVATLRIAATPSP